MEQTCTFVWTLIRSDRKEDWLMCKCWYIKQMVISLIFRELVRSWVLQQLLISKQWRGSFWTYVSFSDIKHGERMCFLLLFLPFDSQLKRVMIDISSHILICQENYSWVQDSTVKTSCIQCILGKTAFLSAHLENSKHCINWSKFLSSIVLAVGKKQE